MYQRTNIPRVDRQFDSGIKGYLTDDDYETLQRTFTEAEAQSISPHPESELAAPYLADGNDDYEAIEYGWPPGFDLPFFDVDWPDSGEIPAIAGGYSPWAVVFHCFAAACYEPGEKTCVRLACTQDIIGVSLPISPPPGFSVSLAGHEICITSPADADQAITIDVLMQAAVRRRNGAAVTGRHAGIRIGPCAESCDCTGLAWDTSTSAETVARSASCAVAILDPGGSCGPYSWSVSGTGFTLDNAVTTDLSNTLNADASACGTATVTVTGCDGSTSQGKVRCTEGRWVFWYTDWSCGTTVHITDLCEQVVGGLKYVVRGSGDTTFWPPSTPASEKCCGGTIYCQDITCEPWGSQGYMKQIPGISNTYIYKWEC